MRHRLSPLLLLLALLPSLALAHGPGGPRHPHARHHARSSVNFGLSIGTGFHSPGYYSPGYYSPGYYSSGYYSPYWSGPSVIYSAPVYTPPPVVIQSQPPVYIERPVARAETPAAAYWYYCASTKSYYPYVSECAEDWQRVSPTPPAPAATQP